MRIGFLHTAEIHIATFDALLASAAAAATAVHRLEANLLATAMADGLTSELAERLEDAFRGFPPVDVILCTCSTLGPFVDRVEADAPTLRIDRPMLERATSLGPDPVVAYCLESTRAPTLSLLNACAAEAGVALAPRPVFCEGAWPAFEAGDVDAFAEAIDAAVAYELEQDGPTSAIILAQASMRSARERIERRSPGTPVLTSPEAAVEAALRIAGGRG
ncbi:MAG: hypothetical protein AAFR16_13560 [Pseudomonadota bacterium]